MNSPIVIVSSNCESPNVQSIMNGDYSSMVSSSISISSQQVSSKHEMENLYHELQVSKEIIRELHLSIQERDEMIHTLRDNVGRLLLQNENTTTTSTTTTSNDIHAYASTDKKDRTLASPVLGVASKYDIFHDDISTIVVNAENVVECMTRDSEDPNPAGTSYHLQKDDVDYCHQYENYNDHDPPMWISYPMKTVPITQSFVTGETNLKQVPYREGTEDEEEEEISIWDCSASELSTETTDSQFDLYHAKTIRIEGFFLTCLDASSRTRTSDMNDDMSYSTSSSSIQSSTSVDTSYYVHEVLKSSFYQRRLAIGLFLCIALHYCFAVCFE